MSNIHIGMSLKILNPSKVNKNILQAIQKYLQQKVNGDRRQFESSASIIILDAILASPTAKSVFNGQLKEEFGIEDTGKVYTLFSIIANDSRLKVDGPKISGGTISLKMTYEAVPKDMVSKFGDIGSFRTKEGQSIPWFEWLTELGDAIIVKEYEVKGGFPQNSRTGDKIMVKGAGWRVPPQHAGSFGNNFITKACDEALDEIGKRWIQAIERALR